MQQIELRTFCKKHDIQIESYSPLMNGTRVLDENTIREIAEQYGKTPAQIILRWHLQSDLVTIPKTVTPDRKSTRLNSSHVANSYAVFCLKKNNNKTTHHIESR